MSAPAASQSQSQPQPQPKSEPQSSNRPSLTRTHTKEYLPDEMDLGSAKHLIVVSNRLPVTISKDAAGEYHFKMSSGGLVSALSGLKRSISFTWIGWTGFFIPYEDRPIVDKRLMEEFHCLAVYLDDDVADKHYNGFSNSILWPLFHYHPGEMNFDESHWFAYRQANMAFAEAAMTQVKPGSMVWIQDYHLMLMPLFLRGLIEGSAALGEATARELESIKQGIICQTPPEREQKLENIKIGFFLHTPFPSSEIYRILPVRREILLGTLQCDLVGFHTYDYARHFLSSCTRILSFPTMPNGVQLDTGAYCQVGTFPIGIDPDQFVNGPTTEPVANRIKALEQRFNGVKLIVGVDRLDYIKGVPQKMAALEVFLEQHPEWVGKVVLIQLAVPSRGDVEEYQNLRSTVNELVGRINGRFGTIDFMPIHFMHKSLPFTELCALYAVSDVCLVTSTRDGMNLVSYEYIATQQERQGVMIISEFAGAAQSLNGSLVVNPWDSQQVANAIYEAVTMPMEVRSENQHKLFKYVEKYSAQYWGTSFVGELGRLRAGGPNVPQVLLPPNPNADSRILENAGVELKHGATTASATASTPAPAPAPKSEKASAPVAVASSASTVKRASAQAPAPKSTSTSTSTVTQSANPPSVPVLASTPTLASNPTPTSASTHPTTSTSVPALSPVSAPVPVLDTNSDSSSSSKLDTTPARSFSSRLSPLFSYSTLTKHKKGVILSLFLPIIAILFQRLYV